MGFSTLFIRRPIATSLLMVAVLLLGILGYRQLPVSALPDDCGFTRMPSRVA